MNTTLPPTPEAARLLLKRGVQRLTRGGRKIALVLLGCFGVSKSVVALRYLEFASTMDIVINIFTDMAQISLAIVAFHLLLPYLLGIVYRPLLEQGTVVRAEILKGPQPFHQRFGGMATLPFMIRGAVSGLESLIGRWLPTRAVNYRVAGMQKSLCIGALYDDEMPLCDEGAYALINPQRPLHAWLIRERSGAPL